MKRFILALLLIFCASAIAGQPLRTNTATEIMVTLLDSSGTPVTSLTSIGGVEIWLYTIAYNASTITEQTEITPTASAGNNDMVHKHNGLWTLELTAGNTNFVGRLNIAIYDADNTDFILYDNSHEVLAANVFDSKFGGDYLQIDAKQLDGSAIQQTGGHIHAFDDAGAALSTLTTSDNIGINWGDVSNPTTSVGLTNTTVGTTTVNSDMVGEPSTALSAINLDHLVKIAVDTNYQTTVHNDSVIGYMTTSSATANYVRTTDSLEDIRDRGDAAWTSGAGVAVTTDVATSDTATSFTLTGGTPAALAYPDMQITVTDADGNSSVETRRISTYTSGRVVTVDSAFSFTPAVSDVVVIERAYLGVAVSGGDATEAKQDTLIAALAVVDQNVDDIETDTAAQDTSGEIRTLMTGADTPVAKDSTPLTAQEVEDTVWDATITGVSHNEGNSAGKRLLQVEHANVIREEEQAQGATSSTITLHNDASSLDDFYNNTEVVIVSGTGDDQPRHIHAYVGSSRIASITPDWVTTPNAASTYVIQTDTEKHVHEMDDGSIAAATFAADVDGEFAAYIFNAATNAYGGAGTYGQAIEDTLADTNELQTNQGAWATATGFSTHNAAAVWAVTMENSKAYSEVMRVIAAVLSGKSSAAAGQMSFVGIDGTTTRLTVTVSSGARTSVDTWDGVE